MKKPGATVRTALIRCVRTGRKACRDVVAVEEPLEIRVGKQRLVVLMRTPGEDEELALGFVLTEGLVDHPEKVAAISHCPNVKEAERGNVLVVLPAAGCKVAVPDRHFYAGSACGICGKTSMDAVVLSARRIDNRLSMGISKVWAMPRRLREAQVNFGKTGGLHAAGLFDVQGRLFCAREDVGRHNAVDKVIGAVAMTGRFPLSDLVLLVSGRASFEICQKAAMAGISIIASVSAPASLAIELAKTLNLTLVGFLRGRSCNLYAGAERIQGARVTARRTGRDRCIPIR